MRYRNLLLSFSGAALALGIACSYGNYDGSYVATDAGSDGTSAGEVVLTKSIELSARQEVLTTPDGVFELTVPQGAFDTAVTITISRLPEREIGSNLLVPVYTVAAPKEPSLPVQVQFHGSNPNAGNINQVLLVAQSGADGTFKPMALASINTGGGGGSGTFWGLTRKLGTYSLVYQTSSLSNTFADVSSSSCLTQCCSSPGGGNGSFNAGAIGGSCVCAGGPNLDCFLRACPNVASAIDRCVEIANAGAQPVTCTNSAAIPVCMGGMCGYPGGPCTPGGGGAVCCINNHAGQCVGNGGPSNTCSGIAIRCDLATKCPDGTKCCVFDNEAYCASTCPNERTWCRAQADCDGGAALGDAGPSADGGPCFEARGCPHGTCGTPPTACTN